MLLVKGITIARRTVAKYRDELGNPAFEFEKGLLTADDDESPLAQTASTLQRFNFSTNFNSTYSAGAISPRA